MLTFAPGPEAQLVELADTIPPERWMLVGGLMVHIHAHNAKVFHQRPTNDVDVVLMPTVDSYATTAAALQSIGYRPHESLDQKGPFHRFTRGSEIVDVMAPEGRTMTFLGRPVLEVPGTRSARSRTVPFPLNDTITINLPDVASALSIKGAAAVTDGFFRGKHVDDGLTLFACGSGTDLQLSKSMRRNVNVLVAALAEPEPWLAVPADKRIRAIQTIRRIRPDWTPPVGIAGSGRIQRGTAKSSTPRQGRDVRGRFDVVQREEPPTDLLGGSAQSDGENS